MKIDAKVEVTRNEIETLIKQYVYEKTGYGVGKIVYKLGRRQSGPNETEPDGIESATITLDVLPRELGKVAEKTPFPKPNPIDGQYR